MADATDEPAEAGFNATEVIEALVAAAADAKDVDDYITYSTLLDIHLGSPERLAYADLLRILRAVEQIFARQTDLLASVAWDLPALLLPCLEVAGQGQALHNPVRNDIMKVVMRIFKQVAERGNPKELFLKAIELLASMEMHFEPDYEVEANHDAEKTFVVQFYSLFEIIIAATRRIKTQYPSRFLTMSSTAMLSFFSTHVGQISESSLPVMLRRLYLFARDYMPPPSERPVAEAEEAMQRRLLQSYLTHLIEILINSRRVEWAKRYFKDIKTEIDVLPEGERQRPLMLQGFVNAGVVEMLERFAQLMPAFDIDLEMLKETVLAAPEPEPESESDDDDPVYATPPSTAQAVPFSVDGSLFLMVQFLMSEEDEHTELRLSLDELVRVTKRFMTPEDGETPSGGVCDALGYLAWRFLRGVTRAEVAAVSADEMSGFLQVLTSLSATSQGAADRLLFHTLVVHLLSRSPAERAYAYIYDTLQYCPFENVQTAFVVVLKDFVEIAGVRPVGPVGIVERTRLDPARRDEIQGLVRTCLDDVAGPPGAEGSRLLSEDVSTLVAWVSNFLVYATPAMDRAFLEDVVARVNALVAADRKAAAATDADADELAERATRATVLEIGAASLRDRLGSLDTAAGLTAALGRVSIE
ncbi:YAP-binding/ALF4/Glomulin [Dipodascopsis tothii]|uniref:YAP-binding/ALF4/Glomulin n=1 Tax=Dipodascopsis tothii TaxID=44089 RepID=UPI0034CE314F